MLRILEHPLTRGLDVDDPRTTALRARIIREKGFLERIYREWYATIHGHLPEGEGPVVELGAGAGFLRELIPDLIASDVFPARGTSLAADAGALPFRDGTLRAIVMTNVLHHLPAPAEFLHEASRALRPGGRIIALEPWVTPWSTLVYRNLHHEPFDPRAPEWRTQGVGPLSRANGALPWMMMQRDRDRLAREYPALQLDVVQPTMPIRYLLSGGLASRLSAPAWSFGLVRALERLGGALAQRGAMFAYIVLTRIDAVAGQPSESSLQR